MSVTDSISNDDWGSINHPENIILTIIRITILKLNQTYVLYSPCNYYPQLIKAGPQF